MTKVEVVTLYYVYNQQDHDPGPPCSEEWLRAVCLLVWCVEGAQQLHCAKHQDPVVVRAWSAVSGCMGKGVVFTAVLVPVNKAINLNR